jgi:hypothetical protein
MKLLKKLYAQGVQASIDKYGLDASVDQDPEDPEESHLARNVAMTAAAAIPFAGLIGQRKAIHQGKGEELDFGAFKQKILPGDVLLTGDRALDRSKGAITAVSGNPEGYHIATPTTRRGTHVAEMTGPGMLHRDTGIRKNERMQILRPKFRGEELKSFIAQQEEFAARADALRRATKRHLRAQGYSGDALDRAARFARGTTYDESQATMTGVKEILLPKFRPARGIDKQQKEIQAARAAFSPEEIDATGKRLATAIAAARDSGKRLYHDILPKDLTHLLPKNVAGICSTVPGACMPAGKPVVPNKLPNDLLPLDYLRSEHFEPVARYNPHAATPHDLLLRHGPLLTRLGVAGALAGGIYGGTKLYSHLKKKFRGDEAKEEPAPV